MSEIKEIKERVLKRIEQVESAKPYIVGEAYEHFLKEKNSDRYVEYVKEIQSMINNLNKS